MGLPKDCKIKLENKYPKGQKNLITDIKGVKVGQQKPLFTGQLTQKMIAHRLQLIGQQKDHAQSGLLRLKGLQLLPGAG